MKRIIFAIMVLALLLSENSSNCAPLKVVTTLSTYASLAKEVGGDKIDVSSIASPRFNPHFIEPKPSDVLKLKRADLFIHSGLDLEAWRAPLVDAAARSDFRAGGARQLDLSTGISLLEVPDHAISRAEGDIHLFGNPHYWTDPRNGIVIAKEIAEKLSELDPANSNIYHSNAEAFTLRLKTEIYKWEKEIAPFKGQEVIGYHNEWIYLINFLNLVMVQYVEPKPGIPPSPMQLERLTDYIRSRGIKALVQATYFPTEASENLSKKTGIHAVTICQSVGELAEASDYIEMVNYNVIKLAEALR